MKTYHPCYDKLIAHLLTFLPDIDPRFRELLWPLLSDPITAKKDIQILKPGEVAEYAYWPVTGFIRSYEIFKPKADSEATQQKTISVSSPDKIALNADSFMNRNPSDCWMEISKGSTVVEFSYSSFKDLMKLIPDVAILALNIVSDAQEDWKRRVKICQVQGLHGYVKFLETFVDVERYIRLKNIASCIGMTPKNLSDIRTTGGFSNEHLRK
ncbi:MAG: hypothetical protein V4594_15695 [Bacteroidota bacterium]